MPHPRTPHTIDDEAALRALIGEPSDVVRAKVGDRLNELTRRFVELAPFVCLATSDAEGRCDVSPRGDPPGFVRVLDDRTLLLPERPGNRLADSLRNLLQNPRLGLLFVLPGVGDTFRVNGRATLTTDPDLLAPCAVEGKPPRLGILVDIEEAYTQCPKAFLRARLWDPERYLDPGALPSGGQIQACLRSQRPGGLGEFDAATYDAARAARSARREGFY